MNPNNYLKTYIITNSAEGGVCIVMELNEHDASVIQLLVARLSAEIILQDAHYAPTLTITRK